MTKKRRNTGRNKPANGRGHVKFIRCALSSKAIPKDKAVKRYVVRNIVDAASLRDIMENAAIDGYALPKIYHKMYFSISAAITLTTCACAPAWAAATASPRSASLPSATTTRSRLPPSR